MDIETINTYNLMADEYDREVADFWYRFPPEIINKFCSEVGSGLVLDVGSGSGRDGIILRNHGLRVICLDASESMVKLTRQKGLPSIQADFLDLPFFRKNIFQGIWAYTSLIHIPKLQMPRALLEIDRVLELGGILGLGLIEGTLQEGYSTSACIHLPRFFVHYQRNEIETMLRDFRFEPFYYEELQPSKRNYLNLLARKI